MAADEEENASAHIFVKIATYVLIAEHNVHTYYIRHGGKKFTLTMSF